MDQQRETRPRRWANNEQARRYYGELSRQSWWRWRRSPGFPSPRLGAGGSELHDLNEIDSWLETRRVTGGAPEAKEAA